MKRLSNILIGLLFVLTPLLVFAAPTVHAAPTADQKKQAVKCHDKWNGKTLSESSDAFTKFQDSACGHHETGNCFSKSENQQGTSLSIVCTKTYGSNKAHYDQQVENSTPDPSTTVPTNGGNDPAIDFATSECGKDACNIISNYINPTINLLTVLVGIAVVIGMIIGAIQVMTSAGDPQKAANGKNHIRNALIALIGYLLLFGVLSFLIPGGVL